MNVCGRGYPIVLRWGTSPYRKIRGLKPRRLRRIVREIYVIMSLVEIPDPLLRRLENSRGKAFREGRN